MVARVAAWVMAAGFVAAALPAGEAGPLRWTGAGEGDEAAVAAWLRSLQYTDASQPGYGAVRVHDTPGHVDGANGTAYYLVIPYVASLAVLGLLDAKAEGAAPAAEAWLRWSAAHQRPDGTVLDHWYDADGGAETTCPPALTASYCDHADAHDSYAAVVLLVAAAAREAGLHAVLAEVRPALERAGDAILALQQPDGLTWARPDWKVQYLMDNSEVVAGLRALAALEAEAFGDPAAAAVYEAAAKAVQDGIAAHLYSDPAAGGTGLYHVARHEGGAVTPADPAAPWLLPGAWYGGTVAIAWPRLFGVTAPDDPVAVHQWAALRDAYDGVPNPDWTVTGVDPTGFLWPSIGHAALLAGDPELAMRHAEFVLCRKLPDAPVHAAFPWPFAADDAGWLLRTLHALPAAPAGLMACPDTMGYVPCLPGTVDAVVARHTLCAGYPGPAAWVPT